MKSRKVAPSTSSNLVDNALKFTAPGGHVRIDMREEPNTARVAVSDDGPGIPRGERKAVLRRFYRGEYSRHAPGSGLGLSLVSAVAGMHGMRVGFNDVPQGLEIVQGWPHDARQPRAVS